MYVLTYTVSSDQLWRRKRGMFDGGRPNVDNNLMKECNVSCETPWCAGQYQTISTPCYILRQFHATELKILAPAWILSFFKHLDFLTG